jgi:hypothetical protein
MRTSTYSGPPLPTRSHPWTSATTDSTSRYYDLKQSPSLIRSALEDFVPWSDYPAIEGIFALLEWLNAGVGDYETNDCEFTGPMANEVVALDFPHMCSGRIMLLFRDLARNQSFDDVDHLSKQLHVALANIDPLFEAGVVATTIVPVHYRDLPEPQLGWQLMVSFWAFGDGTQDSMSNLARLIANLHLGLRVAIDHHRDP